MAIEASDGLTFSRPPDPPLPADSPELQALAGHLRAGRCALFVGAGLSAPAGLPTWSSLIERMVDEAAPWAVGPQLIPDRIDLEGPVSRAVRTGPTASIRHALGPAAFDALCRRIARLRDGKIDLQVVKQALSVIHQDSIDRAELLRLAQQKRFAETAGQCRDRLGRERFHDFIHRTLTSTHDLPAIHRDIVRTPYSCVITTNFDTLIEQAYARYGRFGVPRAPTGAELGQQGTLLIDGGFFVLKAHGDAARPETMVFTADDYRRVIHSNPAFQAILGGILLTHAVLFVGYSLSDTNFRLLLDNQLTIFNGTVPPRYAVLSGVGPEERDILWKTAKLQVLSYPDGRHDEVARCLSTLADQFADGTKPRPITVTPPPRRPAQWTTIVIDSERDRLLVDLVRHRPNGPAERLAAGGGRPPDTRAMGRVLRQADGAQGRGESPMADVARVGATLAAAFSPAICRALAAIPRTETIEIACSPSAARVPWEWTRIGGQPLCLRQPVVRRPADITHEARGCRSVQRPLRALVFGDAGTGDSQGSVPLHYADLEAKTIEHLLHGSARGVRVTRLSAQDATHARVVDELGRGDYDVVHFGGHAWFDDREAFFLLWDRMMLGSELAPLLSRRPPSLMVLDTHFTAFVLAEADARTRELVGAPGRPYVLPPTGPPRGFAEAAMRCGVTAFVGAFGNIADRTGAEFAVSFFAHALTGMTVAEALTAARRHAARETLDSGLMYTAFGYPHFRLVEPVRGRRRGPVARTLAHAKARSGWAVR